MSQSPFDTLQAPRSEEGCWPTATQELLLHAAVSTPERAADAWQRWNEIVDIENDQIDVGSYRLLPLVYANLFRNRPAGNNSKTLEGLYKRTWYENQIRFRACADMLTALHAVGVRTMLLKGCALSIQHYRDVAARPMSDIDLLVPKQDGLRAIEVLARHGWKAEGDIPLSEEILDLVPGRSFVNADGLHVDLHCHVLHFGLSKQTTQRFWDASVPLVVGGVGTRTLSPCDHLLHVCSHGLMWNEVPPMRWVADAMQVLNSSGSELDWDRLIAIAPSCNAGLQLHAAISYLQSEFGADIPRHVLAGLEKAGSTPAQRGLFATLTRGGRWRGARVLWYGFALSGRYAKTTHKPSAFLEYLRIVLGKSSTAAVFGWAVRRVSARLVAVLAYTPDGSSRLR